MEKKGIIRILVVMNKTLMTQIELINADLID